MNHVESDQILLFLLPHLHVCDPGGLLDEPEGLLIGGDDLLLLTWHPGSAALGLAAQLVGLHSDSLSLRAAQRDFISCHVTSLFTIHVH